MATFSIKSRTTAPIVEATVDATTREKAIQATVDAAPAGSEVDVMNVEELPPPPAAA